MGVQPDSVSAGCNRTCCRPGSRLAKRSSPPRPAVVRLGEVESMYCAATDGGGRVRQPPPEVRAPAQRIRRLGDAPVAGCGNARRRSPRNPTRSRCRLTILTNSAVRSVATLIVVEPVAEAACCSASPPAAGLTLSSNRPYRRSRRCGPPAWAARPVSAAREGPGGTALPGISAARCRPAELGRSATRLHARRCAGRGQSTPPS